MTYNIFFLEHYLNNIQTLIFIIAKILMSFHSFSDILLIYSISLLFLLNNKFYLNTFSSSSWIPAFAGMTNQEYLLCPFFLFLPAACLPASPVCNRQRQGYICLLFTLFVLKSVSICGKIRFFLVQSSLLDSCFGRAFFSILYKPNIEYFLKN